MVPASPPRTAVAAGAPARPPRPSAYLESWLAKGNKPNKDGTNPHPSPHGAEDLERELAELTGATAEPNSHTATRRMTLPYSFQSHPASPCWP